MAQMLTMARADKPLKSDAKQFYCLLLVQRKDPLFDNCSGFLLFVFFAKFPHSWANSGEDYCILIKNNIGGYTKWATYLMELSMK